MKKRLEFKCWNSNCQKTYTLLREIGEGDPILWVACPFCGEEGIVNLAPWRKKVDGVYRTLSSQAVTVGDTVYDLPDVLPTKPRS